MSKALVLIFALATGAALADTTTCQNIGNSTYCTTIHADGTRTVEVCTQIGNQVHCRTQ